MPETSRGTVWARLRAWARALETDVRALGLAVGDGRVPWYAKALAFAVVAYALSPIDLIPDFIPVLGYLDDVIILSVGIWLVLRLIPAPLMAELRAKAAATGPAATRLGWIGAVFVAALWMAAVLGVLNFLWPAALGGLSRATP